MRSNRIGDANVYDGSYVDFRFLFALGSINLEQMTICNQLGLRMLDGWQFPNNRGDKRVIFEPKALKAVLGEDILKF